MKYYLSIKRNKNNSYRYEVKTDTGAIICKRNSYRNYVACTLDGSIFFGRLDLIGKGWNKSSFDYAKNRGTPITVVYAKEAIEELVHKKYEEEGMIAAYDEANKHANITDHYCVECNSMTPSFIDEDYCLTCGCLHFKDRDEEDIPLENKI